MAAGRDIGRGERRASSRATPASARPLRALLLDADSAARDEVRRSLEARDVTALAAADGTSGLALLLDELLALDVLVVAADLPGRDALSFTRLVRGPGGERDLAIVALADGPAPELRAELLAAGADAVLDRAAGPGSLADAVLDAVRARRPTDLERPEAPRATPAAVGPVDRWALARLTPLLPA